MDIAPLLNGMINAGGMGLTAAAMFWLVVYLTKIHNKEMRDERASHYNEVRYATILQETYYQQILIFMGAPKPVVDELHRQVEQKVRDTMRVIPKRDSDVPEQVVR